MTPNHQLPAQIDAIVRDIHNAIAELAGVARYPDLTEAIDQLAALASQAAGQPAEWVMVPKEILDKFPEINPSNYDHDDACELNAWGVELVLASVPAPRTAPAAVPVGDEREAFVRWSFMKGLGAQFSYSQQRFIAGDNDALHEERQAEWLAWQARASLAAPAGAQQAPAPQPPEQQHVATAAGSDT